MNKKKYYAVIIGKKPGIYSEWFGKNGAKINVIGFKGAKYKGFNTLKEAENFINPKVNNKKEYNIYDKSVPNPKKINTLIYTDGCSLGNPGPGGYGVIIVHNNQKKIISGGVKYTTNNRMEIEACIMGLKQLDDNSKVTIYSDSKYLINGISKGWAIKWKNNNWIGTNKKKIKNIDLWQELLKLCLKHDIKFKWIKGHDGNPNNEECDRLAKVAAIKIQKNKKITAASYSPTQLPVQYHRR